MQTVTSTSNRRNISTRVDAIRAEIIELAKHAGSINANPSVADVRLILAWLGADSCELAEGELFRLRDTVAASR